MITVSAPVSGGGTRGLFETGMAWPFVTTVTAALTVEAASKHAALRCLPHHDVELDIRGPRAVTGSLVHTAIV